jgi:hypothetical protein
MMKVRSTIATLFAFLLLLVALSVSANESHKKVLFIGLDLSGSMFAKINGTDASHASIQEDAIKQTFSGDLHYCGDVTVVLFGWSDHVHEGQYTTDLNAPSHDDFLAGVTELSKWTVNRTTIHRVPYYFAQQQFSNYPDYEHFLLVTTDESGVYSTLPNVVPDAEVFVVAYTPTAARYAESDMVMNVWDVMMANKPDQVTSALTIVFNEVIASVCSGV